MYLIRAKMSAKMKKYEIIQGVPEVLEQFHKAISQESVGLQERHSAKRCVLSLSFVWKIKNIDHLKISMRYGRYTKKVFLPFFSPLKLLRCV
jgi:hypothetical protein